METKHQLLRHLPNVNDCLLALMDDAALREVPLRRIKSGVRSYIDQLRRAILDGDAYEIESLALSRIKTDLIAWILEGHKPRFRRVINGTGVIVHTNLGRSLLPAITMEQLQQAGSHYGNLEFDLKTGQRGSRYALVEELLLELTGAEAGLVVNNNAAAVLLCLDTLAKGREAIVSRGQLVEIGGSFRIPDVMQRSGARLREVGATNRTHLKDYAQAIGEDTSLLLKVHASNYRIIGFTAEVSNHELVDLGRRHGIPVMEDLGSGCLADLSPYGLVKEPTVQEVVASGVDVVTFSGDKLLGGPQAGIIIGARSIIDKIKANPLNRALRIDKFTLAALESVLRIYLDMEAALTQIPTLAMISTPQSVIRERATRLAALVAGAAKAAKVETVPTHSRVGGGAMPEQALASWALALAPYKLGLSSLEERLRHLDPAVVGRIEDGRLLLDLRTVADDEMDLLAKALLQVMDEGHA